MSNNLYKFVIESNKSQQFIDVTSYVIDCINNSNVKDGIVVVYCPHTTAGITINENADPDVVRDMIVALDKVFPITGDYKHFEGNSHSHLKSSYVGIEKTLIIENGNLILGTWQSIYFCDFDGPRKRNMFIKVFSD